MLNEELAGTLVLDKPIHGTIPSSNGLSASGDHDNRLSALASGYFCFFSLIIFSKQFFFFL